jgi:ABC-type branched-subunit amino acid transport system ATPase component
MATARAADVSLSFGGLRVVSTSTSTSSEGEIVSVIGPNGAGKTTLFNLITGIYEPDEGEILLDGETSPASQPHGSTSAASRARSRRCGSS